MEQGTLIKTNTYTADPNHSAIHFWVRHMMVAKVHGQLGEVKGTLAFDPANPTATQIDVTIDAKGLTTRNEQRDGHLKSPDFLDVEQFPTIAFKSTRVSKAGDGEYEIVGDLTIRGVTKEVVFQAEATPETKGHFGGYVIGVSASGVIHREDFGMTWNQALEAGGVLVGKEIHFQIDAEFNRAD
ncbi:MAG TPA: YceI family protein [Fimbriimonadaceae bacterium]|nr:YceI family protein [Fimbriimonadaceae bacterium]